MPKQIQIKTIWNEETAAFAFVFPGVINLSISPRYPATSGQFGALSVHHWSEEITSIHVLPRLSRYSLF